LMSFLEIKPCKRTTCADSSMRAAFSNSLRAYGLKP
jgi:hypothetical protein